MACRGQRFWLGLVGLVLLGTGCFGDYAIDEVSPKVFGIDLGGVVPTDRLGYDVYSPRFEVKLSEADAEVLGAPGTRIQRQPAQLDIGVDTEFVRDGANHLYRGEDRDNEVSAPCFVDDVVVTNLDTGEEFVVIEAGHCIEKDPWVYTVEGAYDYLIDAGPCTGTVMLGDGRELEVACR